MDVVKAEIRLSFEDTKKYTIFLKRHHNKLNKLYKGNPEALDVLKRLYGLLWPALVLLVGYLFSLLRHKTYDLLSSGSIMCLILFAGLFSYFGKRVGFFIDEEFWARARRIDELDAIFHENDFEIFNTDSDLVGEYSFSDCSSGAEWKDAFYLHAANDKEFIIPKSSIIKGTPETLSLLLQDKLGDRFVPQNKIIN